MTRSNFIFRNNYFLKLGITFKQIKTIESQTQFINSDLNLNSFLLLNFWEKEFEKEKLKIRSKESNKRKIKKEIEKSEVLEKIRRLKEDLRIQLSSGLFIPRLDAIHKKYLVNKAKRENILYSNFNLSKVNKEEEYFNIRNDNRQKIKHLDLNSRNKDRIFLEHLKTLEVKKGSNILSSPSPYYFFSRKHLEKSRPSQLGHWLSSIYNYNKKDRSLSVILDLYVSDLLERFFDLHSINRKNVRNKELLKIGYKTEINKILLENVCNLMENISDKTNSFLKNLVELPSTYKESKWYMKQVQWLDFLKGIKRFNETERSLFAKKRTLSYPIYNLLLSKPLFKHTSYNLVIDLFVYKESIKGLNKLKNILLIRGIYKYMLSMYTNYPQKIRETLNRPRFFYMNLIEPRISSYYRGIINTYALIFRAKNNFFALSIIILLLKNIRIWIYGRSNKKEDLNLYDISGNKVSYSQLVIPYVDLEKERQIEYEKERKKKIAKSKSTYLILKSYFKELHRKSDTPLDLKLLTLWSREGLENSKESLRELEKKKWGKFLKRSFKFNIKRFKELKKFKEKYRNMEYTKNEIRKKFSKFYVDKLEKEKKKKSLALKQQEDEFKKNILILEKEEFYIKDKDNIVPSVITSPYPYLENTKFYLKNIYKEISNMEKNKEKKRELGLEKIWLRDKEKLRNKEFRHENIKYENKSRSLWSLLKSSFLGGILDNIDLKENVGNSLDKMIEYMKKISYQSDLWYLIYSLSFLKSEFYNINRDILLSKNNNLIPNEYDDMSDSYWYMEKMNIKNNKIGIINREIPNERTKNLDYRLGYNEEMFSPYYRYMIPFLILRTYKMYLRNLGWINLSKLLRNSKWEKKIIKNNIYILFNFVVVKVFFDLFNYSYRSLIRMNSNSKLYYLKKIKYFLNTFKRVTYIHWLKNLDKMKKLEKANNYLLMAYELFTRSIFYQVEFNGYLDTKRKVLLPFVLYFEDVLYTIYGKWVIIRIWPLKNSILSSFILTKRIEILIEGHIKYIGNQGLSKYLMRNLVKEIKRSNLKKGHIYFKNKARWPQLLINHFKDKKGLNYANLEYHLRNERRDHVLNSYVLGNEKYSSYSYINEKWEKISNKKIESYVKRSEIIYKERLKELQIKSLKNLYSHINHNLDISGIKFRLDGRTQFSKSNKRSYPNSQVFGYLGSPKYIDRSLDTRTPFLPLYRGQIKANLDYSKRVVITSKGTYSIKVWLYSSLSADLERLLKNLLRIKELYLIILNIPKYKLKVVWDKSVDKYINKRDKSKDLRECNSIGRVFAF
jgi:hypothetical protein